MSNEEAQLRKFESGATRSLDGDRYDPEAALSPMVVERFAEFMAKNRLQKDGSIRPCDNWQKGLPLSVYMKGMWRHFLHLWARHRGVRVRDPNATADIEEDLCSILFNVQGYLYEVLKAKEAAQSGLQWSAVPPPLDVSNAVFTLNGDDDEGYATLASNGSLAPVASSQRLETAYDPDAAFKERIRGYHR